MDFVKPLRPDLSSQQLVRVGQISTLVLVVLACLWAPQIERFSSLWEYLQIVLSFIAPPVAAAFIAGLFSRQVNGTGAFTSLLAGALVSIVFLFMTLNDVSNWFTEMHFLHRTFFLFLFCLLINFVVSAMTKGRTSTVNVSGPGQEVALTFEEKVEHYTWRKEMIAAETEELRGLPWYKNYRIQALILLIVTFVLVVYYW